MVPQEDRPEWFRIAIAGFTDQVVNDRRIAAAFIGGSFSTGTWDDYSDLDLYLIVDDSGYDAVFADRRSFLEAMGRVVLAEDFNGFGFDMLVFMLADGVEGEVGFGRRSGFAHIHGGPYEVLVDRDGLLDGAKFELQGPTAEQRTRSVQRTVAWFWRQLSLFTTAVARGRAWTACGYLEQARREALDLLWLMDAPDSWPGAYEKIEVSVGEDRASPLADTLVDLNLQHQLDAARALADFMAQQGRQAATLVAWDYPNLLEATVRNKLTQIAPRRSPDQAQ